MSFLGVRVGIEVGMGLVQGFGDLPLKVAGAPVGLVLAARLIVEVSRALDAGVLQVVGPGADLARAALG